MASDRGRNLGARAVHEFKRFVLMFLYLWRIFGLYVLNQAVLLEKEHQSYVAHGFAVINALVLAKVMLVAEDLKFARRFEHLPLIVPVLHKAAAFAVLFIVFYVLEEVIVGVVGGATAAASIPQIGGGTLEGVLCVFGVAFVSLIPFFGIKEIGRVVGERELWNLMFRRRTIAYTLTSTPRQV
jgi:hypothetical protein